MANASTISSMKKIVLLSLVLGCIAPLYAGGRPLLNTELGYRTLKQGMKGNDVTALIVLLNEHGFEVTTKKHHKFNRKVRHSIERFQASKGLPVTGIANQATIYYLKYE